MSGDSQNRQNDKEFIFMKRNKIFRQGDVLLVPVKEQEAINDMSSGQAVLALGEVSGHSHRMKDVSFRNGSSGLAEQVLVPLQGSELVHEEHEPIQVPEGLYEVRIQREYDVVEGVRQVMD